MTMVERHPRFLSNVENPCIAATMKKTKTAIETKKDPFTRSQFTAEKFGVAPDQIHLEIARR